MCQKKTVMVINIFPLIGFSSAFLFFCILLLFAMFYVMKIKMLLGNFRLTNSITRFLFWLFFLCFPTLHAIQRLRRAGLLTNIL